uniref:Uncharacterized protein n=1 Tax=Oncorhynchus tshawytscha TaxID=74940 RepID=A0A8C8DEK4_ONCTS
MVRFAKRMAGESFVCISVCGVKMVLSFLNFGCTCNMLVESPRPGTDLSVLMPPQHKDPDTQWEIPALTDHSYVSREPVNKPICHKQTQCGGAEPLTHIILKNDTSSVLYTGLPLSVFFDHVAFLEKFYTANFKMHITDETLITLMKLKLNLLQVVSRILSFWIDTMEEHMKIYIPCLLRETIQNTMPQCFIVKFPNTTCIINCSETILQKAHHLDSRRESYRHSYSSNTPSIWLSLLHAWRISYVKPCHTSLHSKGDQLSDKDVTSTRRIANVERVIGRLKVFKILSQTVPVNLTPKMDSP